tara:strand:+ start:256 stop:453 length:198 start_codon:yes stop_codon:yes gene_type:complete
MSAPENNTNAQKGADRAEAFLSMRITSRRKSAYVKAAHRSQQKKLVDWATHHLDAAAGHKEKGTQ